jgi:hypothetical protein
MLKSGKDGAVRTRVTADPARIRDICHRYAARLYQQALLTTGDPASAEHVVRDVLAGECAQTPVLGICPRDMAALLRAALLRMAAAAAVAGIPGRRRRYPGRRRPVSTARPGRAALSPARTG